jgi:hypothetical protein
MHAGAETPPAALEPSTPAYRATASRYLINPADWPSPRRAAAGLATWLGEADEVRNGLGGRAARRYLELLYFAEEARTADFALREDNHRLAASRYLVVARSAIASSGGVPAAAAEPLGSAQPA